MLDSLFIFFAVVFCAGIMASIIICFVADYNPISALYKCIFPSGEFPRYKKGIKMDTNYEKAMKLKDEYENLEAELKSLRIDMFIAKKKTKEELNWIMSDEPLD